MTDSILRSYYNVSSSTFVPFAVAAGIESALDLLDGETQGFSIDATHYDDFGGYAYPAYVGGPVGGTVAVIDTGTPANNLSDVPLDASNIVQSGTSPKCCHFPTSPYVRWSPHNLLTRSADLTNWTNINTADAGTTITANAGTAVHGMEKAVSLTSGFVYTGSAYMTAGTHNYATLNLYNTAGNAGTAVVNLSNGTINQTSASGSVSIISSSVTVVGGGQYRVALTVLNASGAPTFITTAFATAASGNTIDSNGDTSTTTGGTETYSFTKAQINRGYTATPHVATTTVAVIGIPQSYDVAAAQYGILVEPAATNLCLQSEKFDDAAWTVSLSSISANNTTAPDGATTADRVTQGAGGSDLYTSTGMVITGASTYTASIYLKAGTATWVRFSVADRGSLGTHTFEGWVNTSTGAAGSTSVAGSASVAGFTATSIGNGWHRISLTGILGDNSAAFRISAVTANAGTTRDDTKTFYAWGAQLELGTVATSYIPTLGSSVTRAVDAITVATSTFPYSATASTLYFDFKPMETGYSNKAVFSLNNGSSTDHISIYLSNTDKAGAWVVTSSSDQFDNQFATVVKDTRTQLTIAVAANDGDASQDGGAPATDATITMPSAATTLVFDTHPGTGNVSSGLYYRLVYIPAQVETRGNNIETWRYNF